MRFACATTRGFLAKKMICRIDNWHFLTLYTMRSFFLIQGPTCPSQFGVKYWYLSKITQSFSLNDFAGECKHSFRQLYFLSIGGVSKLDRWNLPILTRCLRSLGCLVERGRREICRFWLVLMINFSQSAERKKFSRFHLQESVIIKRTSTLYKV